MWPFKRKKIQDSLSISKLFPTLKKRVTTVKLFFGAEIAALLGVFGGAAGTVGITIAGTYISLGVAAIFNAVIAIGASLGLSALSQSLAKKPSTGSIQNNGRVFNTKSVTAAIKVCYGESRVNGNWVFSGGGVVG